MEQEPKDKKTIDFAIDECKSKAVRHRREGLLILLSALAFLAVMALATVAFPEYSLSSRGEAIGVQYLLAALAIMGFGVLMSIYRFHLKESAKYEHLHIAFMRIRVVGNNSTNEGFQTEVRVALTKNAFSMDESVGVFEKKKVNNPMPGHPTSDLSVLMINKLFEKIEINKKNDTN